MRKQIYISFINSNCRDSHPLVWKNFLWGARKIEKWAQFSHKNTLTFCSCHEGVDIQLLLNVKFEQVLWHTYLSRMSQEDAVLGQKIKWSGAGGSLVNAFLTKSVLVTQNEVLCFRRKLKQRSLTILFHSTSDGTFNQSRGS